MYLTVFDILMSINKRNYRNKCASVITIYLIKYFEVLCLIMKINLI